jgi:hypothetical protein
MQFVNPLFLIALTALAIPILIHLFNFRQFKKVYFTNVNFLREIQQETKKQSRLKQLLILLARLLAITALVFAFAQPYIPSSKQQKKITEKKAVSVYIDNSFSMEAVATEGRLIDIAKTKALEISSAYAPSDQFQLMTNDFEGKMQRFVDQGQFRKMVEEVQVSSVSRPLEEVVKRQNDIKADASGMNMDAYFISDFQKSTANLLNTKPDSSVSWFLVPVSAAQIANVYIDSLYFQSPVHQPDQPVRLHVIIRNASGESLEKVPVKLTINSVQKAVANFAVGPGSETEIVLTYTENQPGIQHGQVEITDYPIVNDDKFYFSYMVQPSIQLMSINEGPENQFINALFQNDSTLLFTNSQIKQLAYSKLFTQAMIILNSPNEISSGLAQELNRFVRMGGHLAIFPPELNQINSYNPLFTLFNLKGFSTSDTARQRISWINVESDLYADVFEKNGSGQIVLPDNLDLPVVKKYYSILPDIGNQAEVLLKLQNNRPFLVSVPMDRGKVYLFASPLNPAWSEFPKHAIFVPTLYKMALLSNPVHPLYYPTGENVTINIPADSVAETAIFKLKQIETSYEIIPGIRKSGTNIAIQTHDQIKNAGFYSVTSGNNLVAGIAFNFNRLESDLNCYTIDDLNNQIKRFPGQDIRIVSGKKNTLTRQIHQFNQGTPLWKLFIILTLLFIATEIALIRFFK